ncbi:rhomboid family intramembrane serine protease [Candidatus Bathyarchaeota archaeon]|nr:rhomboid family intramembrane serine protease [Candidatus Bathyarchaeota archaeon]
MLPIYDENRSATRPYVNYALIIVNIVVFFYFFIQGIGIFNRAIGFYGAVPILIVNGERLWSLFSSMFMHAGIMHLFGNMVFLWIFGDNVEDALGHANYIVFYLLGGLAASLIHIASLFIALPSLGYADFSVPAVGASGAISAVLGAYVLMYPRARIRTLVFYFFFATIVSIPAIFYLGFWFLYQLMLGVYSLTGFLSGVAFWAHIGGFITGLLLIKIIGVRPKFNPPGSIKRKPLKPILAGWHAPRKPFADAILADDEVRLTIELPGVEEGDIEITVYEQEVAISAQHGEIKFDGRILLPTPVKSEIQNFNFKSGVLNFTLKKEQ